MALIVQKYGGTSVGDIERIEKVADNIVQTCCQGHQVIVVVSAMAGETDRLIALANSIASDPAPRELDVLMATGEQASMALLSIALQKRGYPALSYTGSQVKIHTTDTHTKARIVKIDREKITEALGSGHIVVIAGFQGVDSSDTITTLGRGGSDMTAVALAATMNALECQIYTDVEGVYTTDPRVVPYARCLPNITFEEMLEFASLGAKVLQSRAVEFAGRYRVPLRVLSSFKEGPGTLITYEDRNMYTPAVSGIAFNRDEAKLTIKGIPDSPGIAAQILEPIGLAHIEVDMIVQNTGSDGKTDFTFTVHRRDFQKALHITQTLIKGINAETVIGDDRIAKLSLVGVGMKSHAGIAGQMFRILGQEGINIQLIATSEIKISVIIDEKYLELGVRALHEAFELEKAPLEPIKEVYAPDTVNSFC